MRRRSSCGGLLRAGIGAEVHELDLDDARGGEEVEPLVHPAIERLRARRQKPMDERLTLSDAETMRLASVRTDELGGTTLYKVDARGRLTRLTDPKGRSAFIARGAYGLPVEIVDPAGGVTRIERDQQGNPELVADPTGLSNRVMTPQAAAQAMPNIAQVFTIQNVPVFR